MSLAEDILGAALIDNYCALLCDLHASLVKINALSMQKGSDEENIKDMFVWLQRFSNSQNPSDLYPFMTVQAMLDMALARLGFMLLPSERKEQRVDLVNTLIHFRSSGSPQMKRFALKSASVNMVPMLKLPCNSDMFRIHMALDSLEMYLRPESRAYEHLEDEKLGLIENSTTKDVLEMA